LTNGLKKLIAAEPEITNYDTVVGDGDCGTGMKRGAQGNDILTKIRIPLNFETALLEMINRQKPTDDATIFLQNIIQVVENTMDGTSGALYAIFLNALAHGVREQSGSQMEKIQTGIWAKALESSIQALSKYTPAQPGDRTLMDALDPFVGTLSHTGDVAKAARAAEEGAKKTKGMKASLGRTVYVGGEGWQEVPDPGAYALAVFLTGLSEGLK
jgi:dihydroxyacetone kinase